MECYSYCIAKKINLTALEQQLKEQQILKWQRHWSAIEIHTMDLKQYCYFFTNGTMVTWNIKRYQLKQYIQIAEAACEGLLPKPIKDAFSYTMGRETKIGPHEYFNVDCISLEEDDPNLKLSLSYGLSQSIKLNYFENTLEKAIAYYDPMIKKLSGPKGLKISRRRIHIILSDILERKSELNLTGNFVYQPKFFWQHPNLEPYYSNLEKYFDLSKRAETLNHQINILNEIFALFNGYLEYKSTYMLEVTIIVLIGIEIVFYLLNLHF